MRELTSVGVPPYDYDGAVYDPELWAEVGMLPPVEPTVLQFRRPDGTVAYSAGAQAWVYYADLGRWYLDSVSTVALSVDDAMRRAIAYMPEMAARRAAVVQENATVIDA